MKKPGPVPIGILLLSLGILFTLFVDFYSNSSVLAFVGTGAVWVYLFCLGPLIASASMYFFVRKFGAVGAAMVIFPWAV